MNASFITEKVAENLYVIQDPENSNASVFVYEDGLLLVDTKSELLADELIVEIGKISDKTLRYIINTHWHPDHVGGNERLAKSGAAIIAHNNTLKRMKEEQIVEVIHMTVPPVNKTALPVITFSQELSFFTENEKVVLFFAERSHTDGDAVVCFRHANVMHLGDVYFNKSYPYACSYSGASYKHMIEFGERILPSINNETKIIPGHGPIANRNEYIDYLTMLKTVRSQISGLIKDGRTVEEVIQSKPTQMFDNIWANGVLTPDMFTRTMYTDLYKDNPA